MKVKIKFVDFWKNFNFQNNFLLQALQKNFEVELSEQPEYLFYSTFGDEHWKYTNCIKIFITGENTCPDFNACDYGIGFEYLSFGDRYLRYPEYLFDEFSTDFDYMMQKHLQVNQSDIDRQFCSFVYSNGIANECRERFFRILSQYKQVDSGGRFNNNIGGPVENKHSFLRAHKFDISIENSSHPGYTTEKLVQSFAAGTVPIYWGNERVAEVFNPGAFIRINDFATLEDAAAYVAKVDQDDELYLEMLKEPALLPGLQGRTAWDQELTAFLEHIIHQPKETAFRRNMDYWGRNYQVIQARRAKYDKFARRIKKNPIAANLLKLKIRLEGKKKNDKENKKIRQNTAACPGKHR